MKRFAWPYVAVNLLLVSGCRQNDKVLFTLLESEHTGIAFVNTLKEDESANVMNYLYFYNGGGVAVGDINNDGLPDIFFTGNMVPNRLYLNKGGLEFEDITATAGVAEQQGWCTGVTMVDINQDGLLDIYVCRSADVVAQRRENLLYINHGSGRFSEQAKVYGLADAGYSTQAVFFDYDRDNDLDMFLINHSQQQYAYAAYESVSLRTAYNENFASKLYRNDNGHYQDVSRAAGIASNVLSFGLGVAVSDVNKDGWPDLYVSNDFNEPDHLYLNNTNGTFTNKLEECLDQVSLFSMGSDCADLNNDRYPEIITLDMLPEDNYMQKMHSGAENFNKFSQLFNAGFYYQYSRNMLHLNNRDGTFSEIAQHAGISNTDWSWAPLIADLDNDGMKDLFVTNGYARDYTNMDFMRYRVAEMAREKATGTVASAKQLLAAMPSIRISNYAFQQDSTGRFVNRAKEWGLAEESVASGAAYADFDNDGDLDLVINNINEPASVFRNNAEVIFPQSSFLRIVMKGPAGNRNAVGTTVTLFCGDETFYVEQQPTRGFQSAVDPVLHVGIGSYAGFDSLHVVWPDGSTQQSGAQTANRTLLIDWAGRAPAQNPADAANLIFETTDGPGFVHRENLFNDFSVQSLLPAYLSRSGPCIAKGDINGDGLEDVFIGAATGMTASIYIQRPGQKFVLTKQRFITSDAMYEDTRAIFFDADNDGDLDLYAASGGYEFLVRDSLLQDRLYLNTGSGHFVRAQQSLPAMFTSTGAVAAADFDADGDTDLFIGGRVMPGQYPISPRSYLLINNGKGVFADATALVSAALINPGMITDAVWTDVNADDAPDLVVAGEWMPIKVLINNRGKLIDSSEKYIPFPSSGCWNRILAADLDNDGDDDLIIGNMGTNGQLNASANHPLSLHYRDFDGNGSIDPLLFYYVHGNSYPFASRDDLVEQLPMLNKKYLAYESYARADMNTFFTGDQFQEANVLEANILETVLLENLGDSVFTRKLLPDAVQHSPVYAMVAEDLNGDGVKDLILTGNQSFARIKMGRFRANHGLVLMAKKNMEFQTLPYAETGLGIRGDVRDITMLTTGTDSSSQTGFERLLLVGINDGPLRTYRLKQKKITPAIKRTAEMAL